MKLNQLKPNAHNPRTVTDTKLAMLKKALKEFGDLGGFVFNRKTQQLVSGHQRQKLFDKDGVITITKKYSKPTKTGTVAEGFVELDGERFSYREVYWNPPKEKAANIAANKGAGEWDMPQLASWIEELNSFDVNFDLNLTMFDTDDLKVFEGITVKEHTRQPKSLDGEDEKVVKPAKCKAGQVYRLGSSVIKCGANELHFCDSIIRQFEKQTGEEAVLQKKTELRGKDSSKRQGLVGHA